MNCDAQSLVEAAAGLHLSYRAAAAGETGDHLPDLYRQERDSVSETIKSQNLNPST
jgi:hypothetical protein